MGLQIVDSYVEDTVVSETVKGGCCRMLQILDGLLTRCDCRLWQ